MSIFENPCDFLKIVEISNILFKKELKEP